MKIPLPLRVLVLAMPALACSQPAANGLMCLEGDTCPTGFLCDTTSAMERRCYDRPLSPKCSPEDAVCEDFEGPFPAWNTVNYNQSIILPDTTRAHSGGQSLHTRVLPRDRAAAPPKNSSQAQVTQTVSIGPDIYMRFFLYHSSIFPNYMEIAALLGNVGEYLGASLWLNSGMLEVDAPFPFPAQATPTELTRLAQSPLRLNQWVCLEWQIHVGTQGAIRVWVDDVEDPDLYIPADTSLVAPDSGEGTVVVAGLGFFTDQAVTFSSYDVWFDDIAVSPQRIGCN